MNTEVQIYVKIKKKIRVVLPVNVQCNTILVFSSF